VTYLDPPAAAARRQNLLDRWAEALVGYGCPPESAPGRAAHLLDVALDHGYSLPTALEGAPLTGTGSSTEVRTRARAIARNTREGCDCEPTSARALPVDQHTPTCAVRRAFDSERHRALTEDPTAELDEVHP